MIDSIGNSSAAAEALPSSFGSSAYRIDCDDASDEKDNCAKSRTQLLERMRGGLGNRRGGWSQVIYVVKDPLCCCGFLSNRC